MNLNDNRNELMLLFFKLSVIMNKKNKPQRITHN